MIDPVPRDRTALEKHVAMLEQVRFAVERSELMTPSKALKGSKRVVNTSFAEFIGLSS